MTDVRPFAAQFQDAQTLHRQGRLTDAEARYRALLKAGGPAEPLLFALSQLYLQTRRAADALVAYEQLTAATPHHAGYLGQLADLYQRLGQHDKAADAYARLTMLQPRHADSWFNRGYAERLARRYDDALSSYAEALKLGISGPEEVHLNRGVIYADCLMRPEAAERELEAALALNPAYQPALLNLANLLEEKGARTEALATYEKLLALDPAPAEALARYANLRGIATADDPLVSRLKTAAESPQTDLAGRTSLRFALGKVLDGAGAYEAAFEQYAIANRLSRQAGATYDRKAQERLTDALIAAYSANWFASLEPVSDAEPIFICGMFRSGSTLVERVLGAHPGITAGGEIDFWVGTAHQDLSPFPAAAVGLSTEDRRALAARYLTLLNRLYPGAKRVTDKRPDNFLYIGLIKGLFPRARIIHTRRNVLDNCLSVYFQHLGPLMGYATDLLDTGHYWREQDRLMDHWKALFGDSVTSFEYDAFVADPEATLKPLLAFLGLDWDPRCLEFHRQSGVVKTASYWQVRQPLYASSSGRWRHYAQALEPLRALLGISED